jgi:phosphatidate cytidylyltransferase
MTPRLPAQVLIALGAAFALLIAAGAITLLLARLHPQRDYRELKLRVRTWWLILFVFCLAIAFQREVSVVVFACVSFLAFKEYLSLVPTRRADHRVLFWAYLCIPLQYYWVATEWYGMFIVFVPVFAFLFLPMMMTLIGDTRGFLRAASTLHWGLMTTVFCLSHVAYLLALPDERNPAGGSAALVVYLVFLTEINDVAQYVWGKTLGRHKATPTVSPNKTIEGLLGGVATTTVLAAVLAPWLTPLAQIQAVAAGMLIGFGGFVGDITMSAIKRDIGVKDSGSLLPGHGGILDRLDSLTYTAPLFFHFIYYLHY